MDRRASRDPNQLRDPNQPCNSSNTPANNQYDPPPQPQPAQTMNTQPPQRRTCNNRSCSPSPRSANLSTREEDDLLGRCGNQMFEMITWIGWLLFARPEASSSSLSFQSEASTGSRWSMRQRHRQGGGVNVAFLVRLVLWLWLLALFVYESPAHYIQITLAVLVVHELLSALLG